MLSLGAAGCAAVDKAHSIVGHAAAAGPELTVANGYIPDGQSVSPFANDVPAIAKLDPDLRAAIQRAARDAAADGVQMGINSGWRSKRLQQNLLDEAIRKYGSKQEAGKWVNTPDKSSHVLGKAVDVGPTDADSWLSQHGNDYGLCQTYNNEMWHYELAVAPGDTCPQPLAPDGI
ncbi:D-alanyl-D-alanine carboxypeptidase-like protein [Micromonospora pisi]|uniref:D-alanyl-D-alanine carboxypeptidase-like protein n=1 Tax=Micromonospora pisi TaxID=589240 RepID=A0A495JUF6_9ACTN|nr:M15 family metallopeptidase [Micromonospora pisi]RKR92178.1 D-alanyl-D-alanine carboxypeptidase-like protein [Micromonospora pisi]